MGVRYSGVSVKQGSTVYYIVDTIGNQYFVLYNEVSLTLVVRYIFGKRGLHNQAVEHNVAMFLELSFAVRWWRRLSTVSRS